MKKPAKSREAIRLGFMAELRNRFNENEVSLAMEAFDYADDSHKAEMRDDGSRYIEHPVAVALILLIECGIFIIDFILVSLLHDTPETKNNESLLSAEKSFVHISKRFGAINSLRVRMITKSKFPFIKDCYYQILLYFGDIVSIFVKLADTLHNIRTLEATSEDRQRRKALFVRDELPDLKEKLLNKVRTEIKNKTLRKKLLFAADKICSEMEELIKPYNHLLNN